MIFLKRFRHYIEQYINYEKSNAYLPTVLYYNGVKKMTFLS